MDLMKKSDSCKNNLVASVNNEFVISMDEELKKTQEEFKSIVSLGTEDLTTGQKEQKNKVKSFGRNKIKISHKTDTLEKTDNMEREILEYRLSKKKHKTYRRITLYVAIISLFFPPLLLATLVLGIITLILGKKVSKNREAINQKRLENPEKFDEQYVFEEGDGSEKIRYSLPRGMKIALWGIVILLLAIAIIGLIYLGSMSGGMAGMG